MSTEVRVVYNQINHFECSLRFSQLNIEKKVIEEYSIHGQGIDQDPKGILSINRNGTVYVHGKVDYEQYKRLRVSLAVSSDQVKLVFWLKLTVILLTCRSIFQKKTQGLLWILIFWTLTTTLLFSIGTCMNVQQMSQLNKVLTLICKACLNQLVSR